jgi:8-oxo-dGTP pyrophosphatase MutT (NUDIX family)
MKAEFLEIFRVNGELRYGDNKTIHLPFTHISARAIIVRRMDGAILGALHRPGGKYALPGGAFDDNESAEAALRRELNEEGINLIGSDGLWKERLGVDYFSGYNELCLWYLFLVDSVELEKDEELIDVKWISQNEDPWYPNNREKFLILLRQYLPKYIDNSVSK